MSDQVPSAGSTNPVVDGRNLINVGGGGGITSINGNTTPAQVIAAGSGITVTPGPAGTNTIAATGGGGGIADIHTATDGGDSTGPTVAFGPALNNVVSSQALAITTFSPNNVRFNVKTFGVGNAGVVTDPGAAGASDYLGADNTFRPLHVDGIPVNSTPSIANLVLTPVGSYVAPRAGLVLIFVKAAVGLGFAAPAHPIVTIQGPGGITQTLGATNQTIGASLAYADTVTIFANAALGDTFTAFVEQDSGAPVTYDIYFAGAVI